MKYFLIILFAAIMNYGPTFAEKPPKIIVELPVDTTQKRMIVDPTELMYQVRVDSINQATQVKIGQAILQLESNFKNPKVEEEVGRLIGTYVMEQQLALLDIEIDRAVSFRDTLLLKGLELGLQQLLRNSPEVRAALKSQIVDLENKFKMTEIKPEAK